MKNELGAEVIDEVYRKFTQIDNAEDCVNAMMGYLMALHNVSNHLLVTAPHIQGPPRMIMTLISAFAETFNRIMQEHVTEINEGNLMKKVEQIGKIASLIQMAPMIHKMPKEEVSSMMDELCDTGEGPNLNTFPALSVATIH